MNFLPLARVDARQRRAEGRGGAVQHKSLLKSIILITVQIEISSFFQKTFTDQVNLYKLGLLEANWDVQSHSHPWLGSLVCIMHCLWASVVLHEKGD